MSCNGSWSDSSSAVPSKETVLKLLGGFSFNSMSLAIYSRHSNLLGKDIIIL